jgi:menaquinone-dependent protoporphyrinogen oxidase
MPTLIAYATQRGSTAEIALRIQSVLRNKGISVDAINIKDISASDTLSKYTSFIIGSAVHNFEWLPIATSFLHKHAATFNRIPIWAFSAGCPNTAPKRFADAFHAHDEDQILESAIRGEIKNVKEVKLLQGKFLTSHFGILWRVFWACFGGTQGDFRNWEEIEGWATLVGDEILKLHGVPDVSVETS